MSSPAKTASKRKFLSGRGGIGKEKQEFSSV
jgi:hypothetical protein